MQSILGGVIDQGGRRMLIKSNKGAYFAWEIFLGRPRLKGNHSWAAKHAEFRYVGVFATEYKPWTDIVTV